MSKTERMVVCLAVMAGVCLALPASALAQDVVKYARFQAGDTVAYGVVEGNRIRQLSGDLFGKWSKTDTVYALDEVKLLAPSVPSKVLALAGNYKSHLGAQDPHTYPEIFYKPPSCLLAQGENIIIPKDAENVHYEAELVIVVGKRAKDVSEEDALDYVLGITCGNDVSAREWQRNDIQWWRAKGSDTFGPCGPFIASGLDYSNLQLQLRLNGEVKQDQNTKDMVHGVAQTVSFISRYVTLEPGDLIFTGTHGKTTAIKPGDVVEVELEGVGVLKNGVAAAR